MNASPIAFRRPRRTDSSALRRRLKALLHRLLIALGAGALAALPLQVLAAGLPALQKLRAEGYRVGGLVIDLQTGKPLASLDPDETLAPASVTKLFTTALALETFGPDHTFETQILTQGRRSGDRIEGNLVLKGGGDPGLTNEELWRLAMDVALSGVREVTGDLVVDESLFGRVDCQTEDRCHAMKSSWHSYDGLLSSMEVNYSTFAVAVDPGARPGTPALVNLDPYPLPSFTMRGSVKTVKGRLDKVDVGRFTRGDRELVNVRGTIGEHAGLQRIYRSVGKPALYAGNLFKAFLAAAHVKVAGQVRVTPDQQKGEPLVTLKGRPLNFQLDDMLTYSNNLMADTLAMDLLRNHQPQGPISLPAAGAFIQAYARQITAASKLSRGAPTAHLFDGSGLDPQNRLAPVDLVALLKHVYDRTQDFPAFLGALRVPAHSPARGLSGNDEIWDRLAVKTGSLSMPVSVHTLAGYIRYDGGRWAAFAFMVNSRPGKWCTRLQAYRPMRRDLKRLTR